MKCDNKNCQEEAGNWGYGKKRFCSSDCMQVWLGENKVEKHQHKTSEDTVKAKFIGYTHSSKAQNLDRWECPHCRENDAPECRFNLKPDKRGKVWKCRFCKSKLLLEVEE